MLCVNNSSQSLFVFSAAVIAGSVKLCRGIVLAIPFNLCFVMIYMRGSRNFHERGSNENGNFWSQTRGGPTPKKSRNYLFLGKIFKFQGGSRPPAPPPLDPRMIYPNNVFVYHLFRYKVYGGTPTFILLRRNTDFEKSFLQKYET